MAKDTKQAEALTKTQSAAMARPAFLENDPILGFEQMRNSDVKIARVAIAQSMTRQRKRGNAAFIEGLQEGQMFNSLTGQVYGESVDFIPLYFFRTRIMFKDLDQGGGILCVAPDGDSCRLNNGGHCLHGDFGLNGERPECTEFYNYPSLVDFNNDGGDLVVLSYKSTAMKKAQEWNARMRQLKASMFAQKWRVRTVPDKKDKFDFFNVEFDFLGYVDNKDVLDKVKRSFLITREGFSSGKYEADLDTEGADDFPHGANAQQAQAASSEM